MHLKNEYEDLFGFFKDSLQKIISITHGEIRNDVGCISQYVKHQVMSLYFQPTVPVRLL